LTLRRRFGARWTVQGEATRLELNEWTDDDGDPWYELAAVDNAGAGHRLMQAFYDPSEPCRLGQWLERRAGLPLNDRVPTPADRAPLAAAGGRLGRVLARWFDRRT